MVKKKNDLLKERLEEAREIFGVSHPISKNLENKLPNSNDPKQREHSSKVSISIDNEGNFGITLKDVLIILAILSLILFFMSQC